MKKLWGIFIIVVASFATVFANGVEPWVIYPIKIKSGAVKCHSLQFFDQELKNNTVVIYDYNKEVGMRLKRPWVVVEEGKCYADGGNFLLFRKHIADQIPEMLSVEGVAYDSDLVRNESLGYQTVICPDLIKQKKIFGFCDRESTYFNNYFDDGMYIINAGDDRYNDTGTYSGEQILAPLLQESKNEQFYDSAYSTSYNQENPSPKPPREYPKKIDLLRDLGQCDTRIKTERSIGIAIRPFSPELPLLNSATEEKWTLNNETVYIPYLKQFRWRESGNSSFEDSSESPTKIKNTFQHTQLLYDFETMGCLNLILEYIAFTRYISKIGTDMYERFDKEYYVKPETPEVTPEDYFDYEQLRYATLKKKFITNPDEKSMAYFASSTKKLSINTKKNEAFNRDVVMNTHIPETIPVSTPNTEISEGDDFVQMQEKEREADLKATKIYYFLPLLGILLIIGILFFKKK